MRAKYRRIKAHLPAGPGNPGDLRLARGQPEAQRYPATPLLRLLLGAVVVSDLDGFHPNNEGQRETAQLFLRVIVPKLGVRQALLGSGQ